MVEELQQSFCRFAYNGLQPFLLCVVCRIYENNANRSSLNKIGKSFSCTDERAMAIIEMAGKKYEGGGVRAKSMALWRHTCQSSTLGDWEAQEKQFCILTQKRL